MNVSAVYKALRESTPLFGLFPVHRDGRGRIVKELQRGAKFGATLKYGLAKPD